VGLALAIVSDVGPGAGKLYERFGWTGFLAPLRFRLRWAAANQTRAYTTRRATPSGSSPLNAFRRQRTRLRSRRPRTWLSRLWDLDVRRVVGEDAVGGVTGLEVDLIGASETRRLGWPSEHIA
jgi:hypothetical protein